jgi:hypothetical protein
VPNLDDDYADPDELREQGRQQHRVPSYTSLTDHATYAEVASSSPRDKFDKDAYDTLYGSNTGLKRSDTYLTPTAVAVDSTADRVDSKDAYETLYTGLKRSDPYLTAALDSTVAIDPTAYVDPEEWHAALRQLDTGLIPYQSVNLVAIGSSGSGKTETINSLLGEGPRSLPLDHRPGSRVNTMANIACTSRSGFGPADDSSPMTRALLYCLQNPVEQMTKAVSMHHDDAYEAVHDYTMTSGLHEVR